MSSPALPSPSDRVFSGMTKRCLVKAKYDNIAENPDELAFRRGDVLTVIEQHINGLDGWWLCSLRGKEGIVPANRVTLLAGMYPQSTFRYSTSPTNSSISEVQDYDVPRSHSQELPSSPAQQYIAPRAAQSQCMNGCPTEVGNHAIKAEVASFSSNNQPIREPEYDIPRSLQRIQFPSVSAPNAVYDILPIASRHRVSPGGDELTTASALSPGYKSADSAVDVRSNRSSIMSNTSSPPGSSACDSSRSSMELLDVYDIPNPRPVQQSSPAKQNGTTSLPEGLYDIPKNTKERLEFEKTVISRDSGIYDNAKPVTVPAKCSTPSDTREKFISGKYRGPIDSLKANNAEGVYDIPPQVLRDCGSIPHKVSGDTASSVLDMSSFSASLSGCAELPLELEAAVETLVKCQQDLNTACSRLLHFVRPGWRKRQNLEGIMYDVKICCKGLQDAVQDFVDFGTGSLANAAKLTDKSVAQRLHCALRPLQDKAVVVTKSVTALSNIKWHLPKLEDKGDGAIDKDDLAEIMRCARELCDDASRVASLIHGNSTLIFKRITSGHQNATTAGFDNSTVKPDSSRHETTHSYHEYDYCELREIGTDSVEKDLTSAITSTPLFKPNRQPCEDENIDGDYLKYYSFHTQAIAGQVKDYMEKLRASIEQNDSAQLLVANSKMLVTCAHKMVYIGDALNRTLRHPATRNAITNSANSLCNCLKDTIISTKDAALAPSNSRAKSLVKLQDSANSLLSSIVTFHHLLGRPYSS